MGFMADGVLVELDRRAWRAASDIAEAVNDASCAAEIGQRAVDAMARMVGFDLGSILVAAPGEPWTIAGEIDDSRPLAQNYWRYAAEMSAVEVARLAGPIVRAEQVFERRRRETLAIFREFLTPRGLHEVLVASWLADGRVFGLGVTRAGQAFTDRELMRLSAVLPHVRAAMRAAASMSGAAGDYPGAGDGGPWGLTAAQERTMALAVRGLTNDEIANLRGVSINTVRNALVGVFEKVGVSSRTELAFVVRGGARGEHAGADADRQREYAAVLASSNRRLANVNDPRRSARK
jgi:DNA-binding CsgD family transcriptional regulator